MAAFWALQTLRVAPGLHGAVEAFAVRAAKTLQLLPLRLLPHHFPVLIS